MDFSAAECLTSFFSFYARRQQIRNISIPLSPWSPEPHFRLQTSTGDKHDS